MIRTHIYLLSTQIEYLRKLNSVSLSEHIRKALNEYIEKIKSSNISASASTKGGKYGK